MSQRHRLTISDYAVMAICPSLIVLLLSSLVYFLILCVYQGGYPGRLGYIWFMFILGAVNIARLSIEESRKYALGYAAVLGLATFFVLGRLAVVTGPAAAFAPLVTAALIAIVWFLADRVTYDCTLIDDDEDPGDQGLLDGLTRPPGETFEPRLVAADTADAADAKPVDPARSSAVKKSARRPRRRRTRQPGRTVLWLTAAALPMFGLGQATLHGQPDAVAASVRALAVYLFAALSLLVATSFLGVRSYLRRRGVAMPRDVSVAWLGGGIALVALLLMVSFLLPQPGRILADLQVPKWLESPEGLGPSRFGWGSETADPEDQSDSSTRPANPARQDTAEAREGDSGNRPGPDSPADSPSQSADSPSQPGSDSGGSDSASSRQNQPSQDQAPQNRPSDGQTNRQPEDQPGDQPAGQQTGQQAGQQASQQGDQQDQRPGEEPGGRQRGDQRDRQGPQPSGQEPDQQQGDQPEAQQDRASGESQGENDPAGDQSTNRPDEASDRPAESPPDSATSPPEASSPRSPSFDPSSVLWLLKALIYLVLLLILAAFVWVNRDAILELWQRLQAWLAGKPASPLAAEPTAASTEPSCPAKPFSAFTNPLAAGVDPRRAVIETFQATEAWYREQGQPRGRDETPQEYVRRLQIATAADRQLMEQLTAAYNRIVYGGQSASRRDLHQVRLVWESVFRSR